jgi:small subunit ribosomal protein S20
MANHKSALKRNRQNQKRNALNRSHRSRLRTQLRKMETTLSSNNNEEEVKKALSSTISALDKSVQKGVLHKNAASRRKSRLMSKANALLAPSPSA